MFNLPPVSLFDLSPSMTIGYVLVAGVGIVCISASFLERKLFGGSHAYIFEWIDRLLKIGLPVAYITIVWRLFSGL